MILQWVGIGDSECGEYKGHLIKADGHDFVLHSVTVWRCLRADYLI